jgi:hypothetical protein
MEVKWDFQEDARIRLENVFGVKKRDRGDMNSCSEEAADLRCCLSQGDGG